MYKLVYILIVAILCTIFQNFASGTVVSGCSGVLKPDNIEISDCEREPCKVVKGTNVGMNFTFISPDFYERMKPTVVATVMNLPVPYPVGDDACVDIVNTPCPIAKDEFIKYNFNFPISSIIPSVAVNVRFALLDKDSNKEIVCFSVNLQVT